MATLRRRYILGIISHDKYQVILKNNIWLTFDSKFSTAWQWNEITQLSHIDCRSIIIDMSDLIAQWTTFW